MEANKYILSKHAELRMSQRNLSFEDLLIALQFGQKHHRSNSIFFFLGKNNLPKGAEKNFEKLIGTTVLVIKNSIVTVYRNRRASSKIRRKAKRQKANNIAGNLVQHCF